MRSITQIHKMVAIGDIVKFVESGDVEQLRSLLASNVKLLSEISSLADIETPLHIAAAQKQVDAVIALLDHGININAQNRAKHTALHIAAWNGAVAVAEVLVKRGANVDIATELKHTALILAAQKGSAEIVKMLVDANADVSAADDHGWTALHYACREGHSVIVQELCQAKKELVTQHLQELLSLTSSK